MRPHIVVHYAPPDPLHQYYTDSKGKQRRKKASTIFPPRLWLVVSFFPVQCDVAPGLSPHDAKILKTVQRRARCLGKGFDLCGLRFGWTFIIGIVPGAGDVACTTLNYMLVVRKAREADLPPWLIGRMMFNDAVSAIGGSFLLSGTWLLLRTRPTRGMRCSWRVFADQRRVSQVAGSGGRGKE